MDTFSKRFIITLIFTISSVFSAIDTSQNTFYLYSYFEDGSAGEAAGTFLLISNDGINWEYWNDKRPIISPSVGSGKLMRDPCLFYSQDSTFHLVWTTGWTGQDIGYSSSKDLITWSEQRALSVMSNYPNTAMCWAPEIFYNDLKQEYMIYWSSDPDGIEINGNIKHTYYVTTKDFKTFSTAKKLFSQDYSEIDANLLKTGENSYKLFFKDERINENPGRIIYYVTSSTPEGPWSDVSAGITQRGVEGPAAIKIGDEFRVYFDPYSHSDKKYRYVKSTNGKDWSSGTPLSVSYRHGQILQIPKKVALWLVNKSPMNVNDPGTDQLIHQWTFDNGTATDIVGSAHGELKGGATIENRALKTSAPGQYLALPVDKINITNTTNLSMEIWFTSTLGANTDNSMLCYFGNTTNEVGSNGCFISAARKDNFSRTALSCGNETTPWSAEDYVNGTELDDGKLHQMVSVISPNSIVFYIDGLFCGTAALRSGNRLANIKLMYAYLAKSGYSVDPTWIGSIDEFSIFQKALSAGEVLYLYEHHGTTHAIKTFTKHDDPNYYYTTMFGRSITTPLSAKSAVISLFNLNGELLSKYSVRLNTSLIPANSIPHGMYSGYISFIDNSGNLISNRSLNVLSIGNR